MSKNSTLDQNVIPPKSPVIAARIIELTQLKTQIEQRIEELQKAGIGEENLAALAGKKPGSTTTKLHELPWKPSKFPADNPRGEWVHASEVPAWVEEITFPITDGGYKYFKSKNKNLTRYKEKAK